MRPPTLCCPGGPLLARVAALLVGATLLVLSSAAPARAVDVRATVGFSGGSLAPWSAMGEVGNAYAFSVGVWLDDFRVLASGGGVLPASRPQGHFGVIWAEAQWHPLRMLFCELGVQGLSPYVLAGLGVATRDDPPQAIPGAPVDTRWAHKGPAPIGILGLGLSYGPVIGPGMGPLGGLSIGADVRIYNITHGGLTLSIGYTF